MQIKPIKKKFESIVDAVAAYNPDKKREPKAKPTPKKSKRKKG
ncbi:MAG TPA: hypothetical protein VIJ29_04625 [Candidatus Paceibacterota bacterium]